MQTAFTNHIETTKKEHKQIIMIMKTAYIVYDNYLTPDGDKMSIGGIQTYITNLIPLLQEAGYCIHLYQQASLDFEISKGDVLITGVTIKGKKKKKKYVNYLKRILPPLIDQERDLLIFACETLAFESKNYRSIAIQHGIFWDMPFWNANTHFKYLIYYVRKAKRAWDTIMRVSSVRYLVCVDYNFVNWYRALTAYPLMKFNTIPNFTDIPTQRPVKPENKINIIFARRFFEYRGTRLFTKAIKPLLHNYPNLFITIAGEGPDEQFLKKEFDGFDRVRFIKYQSNQSLTIHIDKHIAVVPTLGSEGTSLSLLEAMASGCAVICTNVGGMTNIVLDHYNGLIINPDEKELCNALSELINERNLRERISQNAYDTALSSFSIKKWQHSWRKVIKDSEN